MPDMVEAPEPGDESDPEYIEEIFLMLRMQKAKPQDLPDPRTPPSTPPGWSAPVPTFHLAGGGGMAQEGRLPKRISHTSAPVLPLVKCSRRPSRESAA